MEQSTSELAAAIREEIRPVVGGTSDYDSLMALIGDADFVLLGEATHGTQEFYHQRAQITKRLIQEKGFTAVAVEADWPDAYRVNRFVWGESTDHMGRDALLGFLRFPTWMWRNTETLDFIDWLRSYNDTRPPQSKISFYGLDLYSLHASVEAVLSYLDGIDPQAAKQARYRYACFDHYGEDTQAYGYAAGFGLGPSCEEDVLTQLKELQRRAEEFLRRDGFVAQDEFFYAEQNARLVKNAERYYRAMFQGHVPSWNLRDRHMAETLDALGEHHRRQGRAPKFIIWAHNSHLGDARATDMHARGELNLGQLVRERYGNRAVLVGFSTYSGSVTAASTWGGPVERKMVRPALPDSYEAVFHEIGVPSLLLSWERSARAAKALRQPRLERAIGVIYLPETERISHYFFSILPDQFDAVIHWDRTQALQPLDQSPTWEWKESPETFPSGV